MKKLLLFLVGLPLLAATHYISNQSGASDSNAGTKASPWLHAPGMPNCTSNCASYTPVAGDSIIFRGGDTWHFGNASATPYVGAGGWDWTWSGSSTSNVIYIGVDMTWFAGSSWVRPILTEDNPLNPNPGVVNSQVASCTHTVSGGNQLINIQAINVTFDNFEFTGFCWSTNNFGDNMMLKLTGSSSPNGLTVENCYVHGWTNTAAGQAEGGTWLESYNQEPGLSMLYNVVDGSDSDPATLDYQVGDLYVMAYNVIRFNQGQNSTSGCHNIHDNLFEHMDNVADGSGAHSDVLQCYGETGNGSSDPNLFYNNVFRYIPDSGAPMSTQAIWFFPPTGQTDYAFNNVYHDVDGTDNFMFNQSGGPGGGNLALYNNTGVLGSSGSIFRTDLGGGGTVTSINNHWVTTGTISSIFTTTSIVTETTPTYMTPTAAATQGYTSANDYAPTAGTNSTVIASGTNEASFCNGLTNTAAKAACNLGTTNGCSYNVTSHSVTCPALTANARPATGAWQTGAYEYSAGTVYTPGPLSVGRGVSSPGGLK